MLPTSAEAPAWGDWVEDALEGELPNLDGDMERDGADSLVDTESQA